MYVGSGLDEVSCAAGGGGSSADFSPLLGLRAKAHFVRPIDSRATSEYIGRRSTARTPHPSPILRSRGDASSTMGGGGYAGKELLSLALC